VQNSPADRVPSHGTALFATAHAVDFVPLGERDRTARVSAATWLRPEPPERFPGFGRPLTAPADGEVVLVHDAEPDHGAHRGLPSVWYALTQRRRAAAGWAALAGNHVVVRLGARVYVALCHLQQGSAQVVAGQHVTTGQPLARCGNSGNSTEPHVHVQAMDGPGADRATALPMTFGGRLPRNGEVVAAG
jgi:murein DD-endopeptidase MepM/ murein hydrolase activator NlpD